MVLINTRLQDMYLERLFRKCALSVIFDPNIIIFWIFPPLNVHTHKKMLSADHFFFHITAWHQSWRSRGHFYGRRWFGSWIVHLRHWCIYCQKWCWYRYHCRFSRIQHFICDCRMRIRSKRSLKVCTQCSKIIKKCNFKMA